MVVLAEHGRICGFGPKVLDSSQLFKGLDPCLKHWTQRLRCSFGRDKMGTWVAKEALLDDVLPTCPWNGAVGLELSFGCMTRTPVELVVTFQGYSGKYIAYLRNHVLLEEIPTTSYLCWQTYTLGSCWNYSCGWSTLNFSGKSGIVLCRFDLD